MESQQRKYYETASFQGVTSEIFIGRKKQLQEFRQIFEEDSNIRVLNIHSRGKGGIGKTQLLIRMQDICRGEFSENVIFNETLIDFYHIETRSKIGLMSQIPRLFNVSFTAFDESVKKYQQTQDASERELLLPQIEQTFQQEYVKFTSMKQREKKKLVLFFDTFEILQSTLDIDAESKVETNKFLTWIKILFFPMLVQPANACLVVSGRDRLHEIDKSQCAVHEIELDRLSYEEALEFWYTCFGLVSIERLSKRMSVQSENELKLLYALVDGHPILLALIADWVKYKQIEEEFSITALLQKITQETGKISLPPSEKQQIAFERGLIERISSLSDIESRAIVLMAVAYHRMTPELFYFLTEDIAGEDCQRVLLDTLRPLSFIKYKEGNIVLLHDEMRRLVLEHWWKSHDPERSLRKQFAGKLLNYYDNDSLARDESIEKESEIYKLERLSYSFLAKGLDDFCQEFDIALDNGEFDRADLLWREADAYHRENPGDIPLLEALRIPLRHVRENSRTDRDYTGALTKTKNILKNHHDDLKNNSELYGHFLLERGISEFYLEEFESAINSFQKAFDVFQESYLISGDDYWPHWAKNWIGYAYYRQAKFKDAERYLHQSRKGFYNILVTRGEKLAKDIAVACNGGPTDQQPCNKLRQKRRNLLQGLQYTHGNLAALYSHTGQFELAIRYGEMGTDIVRYLPQNNQEIARYHNTLGYAFARAGSLVNAREQLSKAEKLLQHIDSRLITGRVKINLGFLEYRVNELASLLEFYLATEMQDIIQEYVLPKQSQVETAIRFIHEAIDVLSKKPVIRKELADAYYHLGWFHTISSAEGHWEKAEDALKEGGRYGEESKFQYRVVSVAGSLVNLYYFWDRPSLLKTALEKMKQLYQAEIHLVKEQQEEDESFLTASEQGEQELLSEIRYPNLFGKYELVRGNIAFDQALEKLYLENAGNFGDGVKLLKKAFDHYTRAAILMNQFHEQQYYFVLQVMYNRFRTLIDDAQQQKISLGVINHLSNFQSDLWSEQAGISKSINKKYLRKFRQILKYTMLRMPLDSSESKMEISNLQDHSAQVFNKGNYAWALILTDCLIGVYRTLLLKKKTDDTLRETLILGLERQAGLYREVREKYQATQYIQEAYGELSSFQSSPLKKVLQAYLISREKTLSYKRGEYGRLLELHLRGELESARGIFDDQLGDTARQEMLQVFQHSEQILLEIIPEWEVRFGEIETGQEKRRLEDHLKRFYDLQFRISEFLILEERFQDSVNYLQEIIGKAQNIDYTYREVNAMQRYLSALYFNGNFDNNPHCFKYEKLIESQSLSPRSTPKKYPSAVGRLRILQGNALFSRCFQFAEISSSGEFLYRPRQYDESTLRKMLGFYIEACNFMAQHSQTNFTLATRVLQRRIRQISDKNALEIIQQSLRTLWDSQDFLQQKQDEYTILDQFTRLRSLIIK